MDLPSIQEIVQVTREGANREKLTVKKRSSITRFFFTVYVPYKPWKIGVNREKIGTKPWKNRHQKSTIFSPFVFHRLRVLESLELCDIQNFMIDWSCIVGLHIGFAFWSFFLFAVGLLETPKPWRHQSRRKVGRHEIQQIPESSSKMSQK